jgi:chromosomal replication initiator protein
MNSGIPAKASAQLLWNRLLDLLRSRIPETAFNTWFAYLGLVEAGPEKWVVGVPNAFVLEYVEHHYKAILESAATEIVGRRLGVSFTVSQPPSLELFHPGSVEDVQEFEGSGSAGSKGGAGSKDFEGSHEKGRSSRSAAASVRSTAPVIVDATVPLYSRYTFENFVIGDCNQLAHAACMAVAEAPGRNKFNPLLLYGGTGMGKTHLLQAIAHFCLENETVRKIVYRTSEEFTREYIEFVQRNKDSRAFYKAYKDTDILLLDDIQFLAGKPATQDEFFNIFSALQSYNRQIIITSDRPPTQIQGLHARLLSRFDTGFLADMQPPNLETRLAILHKKAEKDADSCVNEDVLSYVASYVTSNVRELEGTLIKLSAYADCIHAPITVAIAKQILGDTVRNHNRGLTLRRIIDAVATEFGLSSALLTSQTRKKNVAEPRHAAMYLARTLTDNSLYTIGLAFNRDYSTAIHSIKRVEHMMESDLAFRACIDKIRSQLV